MIIDSETQYFLSQDGLRLYYRHWDCEQPQKIVCIVHGHGEHSRRYNHVAEALNKADITVFALDLRGHGISEGKRGHAKSYLHLMSDVEEFLKTARAEYTDLPLYLYGHSMGGNLVANYMIRMNTNEISGFILTSPWLKLAFEPPAWKVRLGEIFDKIYPALTQPSELDASQLSKEATVVKAYKEDPLVHDKISARLFRIIVDSGIYALNSAKGIKVQGMVLHGNADNIIDWHSSRIFTAANEKISFTELDGV
ncbi:MAG: alpha/beta hydrolase, partial [Marinoscillum sp.]